MHPKKIIAYTVQPNLVKRIEQVCSSMEATLSFGKGSFTDSLHGHFSDDFDLMIADVTKDDLERLTENENVISGEGEFSMLLIVGNEVLSTLRLPVQITSDFICKDSSDDELSARIRRLLWPGEEIGANDFIRQGSLSINLSTYQVKIGEEPVDFTYLEYALLAFMVTHPGHTYSRDALLSRVWDFDYYGGSRTVDVHVRRIRAKLGPDLAQYLKTVRGVGYLWSY